MLIRGFFRLDHRFRYSVAFASSPTYDICLSEVSARSPSDVWASIFRRVRVRCQTFKRCSRFRANRISYSRNHHKHEPHTRRFTRSRLPVRFTQDAFPNDELTNSLRVRSTTADGPHLFRHVGMPNPHKTAGSAMDYGKGREVWPFHTSRHRSQAHHR